MSISRFHHNLLSRTVRDNDSDVAEPTGDRVDLQRALRSLPASHRRAITLHYLADLSVDDVAREMDAAPSTVKVWLSRGRDKLSVLLDDQEVRHG